MSRIFPTSVKSAIVLATEQLTLAQARFPRLDAETLMMSTLACDRAFLHAHPEQDLTDEQSAAFEAAISQRVCGVPLQYIIGHQEFWGLDFLVNSTVLIPRPETEILVESLLSQARDTRKARILDVGTGSGCIAISLAKELPEAEIHATDISPEALEVARTNAFRLGVDKKVQFHLANLMPRFDDASFDFVVSNPPYVGFSEEGDVQKEVREHEPRNAVFAGNSGIEIIRQLIPRVRQVLKPGGWMFLEISATIEKEVRHLLEGWRGVEVTDDLQEIPRAIRAQRR